MPLSRSGPTNCSPAGRKGKNLSVKYTSDELTTRPMLGTHTRYDPGDKVLWPKLTPTHAWASMVVFTTALDGFTVCARHPTGMILMIRGCSPVIDWKLVSVELGGPVVRLSTSTACCTICGQNETGRALATK